MNLPGPPGDSSTRPLDRIQLTWSFFQRVWNLLLPQAADDFLAVAALASSIR